MFYLGGDPVRAIVLLGVAFVLSLVLCRAVIALGVRDAPDGVRKTQSLPVPTSGGIGFAIAAVVTLAAEYFWARYHPGLTLYSVAASFAMLVIGAWDDRAPLPARTKLIAMLAVSLSVVAAGVRVNDIAPWEGPAPTNLPVVVAAAGSILWLVVVMNAVNFMDGANGLAMGMAAVASTGLAIVAFHAGETEIAIAAAVLATVLAGFLVLNVPGKLYAGDAGALFAGMMLGCLSLLLVRAQPDLLLIPPLLLLPFLTDVLLTLAWRAKHGKKLFEAHRDHVYQIALRAGLKHWHVAAIHAVWAVNVAAVAVVAALVGGRIPAAAFLLFLAASIWVNLRARKAGEAAGLVGAGRD